MTAKAPNYRQPCNRLVALLIVAALSPALASCSDFHRLSSEEALIENRPDKAHPIAFVERDEVLDVELPPQHSGLSHSQYVDIYRFALRYREEATGVLMLSAPGSHPATRDTRRALHAAGLDSQRIKSGGPARGGAISLAYHRPVAVPAKCGHWYRDVGRERERVHYPDFGCSTQSNLAHMVANSRDLMTSQEESPASSERRGRIWSKYVAGDAGGAAQGTASPESVPDGKPKAGKK